MSQSMRIHALIRRTQFFLGGGTSSCIIVIETTCQSTVATDCYAARETV